MRKFKLGKPVLRILFVFVLLFQVWSAMAADETDMPLLRSAIKYQESMILPNLFSQAYEPNRDFFIDQKYLIPALSARFVFDVDLTPSPIANKQSVKNEFQHLINQIFSTPFGSEMRNVFLRSGLSSLKISIFVLYEQNHFVDSWTDSNLVTYLFLNGKNVSRNHILKLLVHEFAQMTTGMSSESDVSKIKSLELSPRIESCGVEQILRRSDVRLTVSTLRAFATEKLVLAQMGLFSTKNLEEPSCVLRLKKVSNLIDQYRSTLNVDTKRLNLEQSAVCNKVELKTEFVDNLVLSLDGEVVCRDLETPRVSDYILQNVTFGPRPGIGNGGGL